MQQGLCFLGGIRSACEQYSNILLVHGLLKQIKHHDKCRKLYPDLEKIFISEEIAVF